MAQKIVDDFGSIYSDFTENIDKVSHLSWKRDLRTQILELFESLGKQLSNLRNTSLCQIENLFQQLDFQGINKEHNQLLVKQCKKTVRTLFQQNKFHAISVLRE